MPLLLWTSVTMTPGLTALTRTPRSATSRATDRVRWSKAALLMLYTTTPGNFGHEGIFRNESLMLCTVIGVDSISQLLLKKYKATVLGNQGLPIYPRNNIFHKKKIICHRKTYRTQSSHGRYVDNVPLSFKNVRQC